MTAAGLNTVLADVDQLVEELVANAARRTEAPLEVTIDAHDDVVRVEVHNQAPRVALGLEEHPWGPPRRAWTGRNRQPRSVGRRAAGGARPGPLGGTPWWRRRGLTRLSVPV